MRGGYASLAEAQAELGKVKGRIRTGVFQMHGITGRMWFTERIASKIDLRPNTLRLSQQHIDRYLIPPLGGIRIEDLRSTHVEAMMARVTGGPASAQRVRATLRSACRMLCGMAGWQWSLG
jgi:hypothetical protein